MSSKQKYLGICSLGRVYITDLRGARRHLAKFMAMHCISVSSSRYMHSPKYCQYWTLKIFWDTHCTKLFLQINTLNKLRFGFFRSCVRTLIKKVSTTSLFFKNITQILTLHKQHITVLLHDRHYFFFFFLSHEAQGQICMNVMLLHFYSSFFFVMCAALFGCSALNTDLGSSNCIEIVPEDRCTFLHSVLFAIAIR